MCKSGATNSKRGGGGNALSRLGDTVKTLNFEKYVGVHVRSPSSYGGAGLG